MGRDRKLRQHPGWKTLTLAPGGGSIADGSITEAKLDIGNNPTDFYYLSWDDINNKMRWRVSTFNLVQTDDIANLSVTTSKLAVGSVTSAKLSDNSVCSTMPFLTAQCANRS